MAGVGQEVINIFATISAKGKKSVCVSQRGVDRCESEEGRQNTIATVRPLASLLSIENRLFGELRQLAIEGGSNVN